MENKINDVMSIMVMDVNKAFELKEELEKSYKDVIMVSQKRTSGTWYELAYSELIKN